MAVICSTSLGLINATGPCVSGQVVRKMIEKLEIIMQKDAPYLDVNKHDEAHPYYNVPPNLE